MKTTKTTTEKHTNTLEIMANFNMLDKFNTLVESGTAKDEALTIVNNSVKSVARAKICTVDGVKWEQLIDGVMYEQLTEDGEPVFKVLKVSDLFILRPNKKSDKMLIDNKLFTMLEAFGVNVLENELTALDDNTLLRLKVYTKYEPKFECFTCDTCTSNNKLTEQFNEIVKFILGEDANKVYKNYVTHLKRQYVKATKDGYKNGNALALLQLVIEHIYTSKYNINYTVKSGLSSHKARKEDK